MSKEMFEKASRLKLRFTTRQGLLSVEDLWDLSLNSLDTIAKAVNKELGTEAEGSFIPNKVTRKAATHNDLRLEILKHVINTKVAEDEAKANRAAKAEQLARLKTLAANKQDEAFAAQSLDEILKQIKEMEEGNEVATAASA